MRQPLRLLAVCAATAFVVVTTASGQTFTYFDDFNSYAQGVKPDGWNTKTNHPTPVPAGLDPAVMTADPLTWATQCTTGYTPAGCSTLGATGVQQYTIPWSGGGRFNLIHPGMSPGDSNGWAGVAWYTGSDTTRHTGTYPIPLQSNRLRVSFDMIVRTGDARCADPADGGVFAVVPVTDFTKNVSDIGGAGGGLGWLGLGGFAIEFDIYYNGSPQDPSDDASKANHVGLNVNLKGMESVVTNSSMGLLTTIPRFVEVGNNNQPLHITVFFNDDRLAGGGVGVVQVYMKVDPATYDASFGGTAAGAKDYGSTGGVADPDNTSATLGIKVLEACVGAWPASAPTAIFGLTGAIGGCNAVYQVDNIAARADAITPATACAPTGMPTFSAGTPATLTPDLGSPDLTGLSQPGWDVRVFPTFADGLQAAKNCIGFDVASGFGATTTITGEADLNYNGDGAIDTCLIMGDRAFPGQGPGGRVDYFSTIATGWMVFPADDGSKPYPRHYYLNVNTDDGYELVFGAGTGTPLVAKFLDSGRGCGSEADTNSTVDLTVNAPGVYPVQVLQYEMTGGSAMEFVRRFKSEDLLLAPSPPISIGAADGGLTDQPKIYGLYKGNPAPDMLATYTASQNIPTQVATLAASEKVSGGPAGVAGLKVKTVKAPNGLDMYSNRDDAGDMSGLQMLDLMNDKVSGTPTPTTILQTVNIHGSSEQGDSFIPNGVNPPGFGPYTSGVGEEAYGIRWEGFVTFPTAGTYTFGAAVDDDMWIRVGRDVIWSRGCCGWSVWQLVVSTPGTYPIRIDGLEGGGDDVFEWSQFAPGVGRVAVGAPGSTVTFSTEATSGPYVWAPVSKVAIGADRKVAEVGQGTDPGWNAELAMNFLDLGGGLTATKDISGLGWALMFMENDLSSLGSGLATHRATGTPSVVNFADGSTTDAGRFIPDQKYTDFASAYLTAGADNNNYAVSFTGYVEFAAAGYYGIGSRADDGPAIWVAGNVVNRHPVGGGADENTIGTFRVDAPGLYPIRVDAWDGCCDSSIEVFQYLPDRNVALLNDTAATAKVYRSLSVPPASTKYIDPHRLNASAKAADITLGGDPGFKVQGVDPTYPGNADAGHPMAGRDKFNHLRRASDTLDAQISGNPLLGPATYTQGTCTTVVNTSAYDAVGLSGDQFAVRITGYLALKAGGHTFGIASDDGAEMYIGGSSPEDARVNGWHAIQTHSWKGADPEVTFWVWVPEDGLYPFAIDQWEDGGGEGVTFNEIVFNPAAMDTVEEPVNGGTTGLTARAYVDVNRCGIPWVDSDGDHDVDEADFGRFQTCFTGTAAPITAPACKCYDRTSITPGVSDNFVDAADYTYFLSCWTGPGIPWTASANCPK